jgi:hypothetical protein
MKCKYALAAFRASYKWKPITEPFWFDDSTFIVSDKITKFLENGVFEPHWRDWLGSIRINELTQDCDTIIVTFKPSDRPDVLDQGNKALSARVSNLIRTLPLATAYNSASSNGFFLMSGQALSSASSIVFKDIRESGLIPNFVRPHYLGSESQYECPFFEADSFLTTWRDLDRLIISKVSLENRQILECFRSFQESFSGSQLEFKVPNLVRSVECLIDCRRADDFAAKVSGFIGSPPMESTFSIHSGFKEHLVALYQLRNDCVHGKPFGYSLGKNGSDVNSDSASFYEALAEWVARETLKYALARSELVYAFKDRGSLERAWRTPEKLAKQIRIEPSVGSDKK